MVKMKAENYIYWGLYQKDPPLKGLLRVYRQTTLDEFDEGE
jgi:hypothetical protein